MFVAADVDEGWRDVGEALLVDAISYRSWNEEAGNVDANVTLTAGATVAELRAANGSHRVVSVADAVALIRRFGALGLQPLCGGLDPAVAWPYLRRVVHDVLPAVGPIDPAPHKGVLPLPFSALRGSSAVIRNPFNYSRSVTLTFGQFQFGFANAIPEEEARALYEEYHVACPGPPLFQVATANFRPGGESAVNLAQAERGPMLFISGEKDHLVTWSMANAAFKRWKKHSSLPTEIIELPDRGHSLILDHGWGEVADTVHAFLQRHAINP